MWSYIPPDAIASSEVVTTRLASSPALVMYARSTSSRWNVDGNLGADPNPPHSASNAAGHALEGGVDDARVPGTSDFGVGRGAAADRARPAPWRWLEVGATVVPHVVEGVEQLQEVRLGEVRPAPERSSVGVEGDRHRPSAAAGQRLHRVHVDGVDVGPLLAVDLDVDELGVHHGGDLVVLERLVGHHVAPVAGRVPDRQQDRHVAAPCLGERLVAPRIPVDRVVAVLTQVRRGLLASRFTRTTILAALNTDPKRDHRSAPHSADRAVDRVEPMAGDFGRQGSHMSAEDSRVVGYVPGVFDMFRIGHLNIVRRSRYGRRPVDRRRGRRRRCRADEGPSPDRAACRATRNRVRRLLRRRSAC